MCVYICVCVCVCIVLEKWYWWIYLPGRSRDAGVETGFVDTEGNGEGGRTEGVALTYTLPCVSRYPEGSCCIIQEAQHSALRRPRGVRRWGGGRIGQRIKERIHVYLQLIHMVVWQKPTQHCKAIIFQLKVKKKKKKTKPQIPIEASQTT